MFRDMIATSRVFFVILKRLALASALTGIPNTASAFDVASVTEAELALSPSYCAYAQLFPRHNTPAGKRWAARMGEESFRHIHHYCWGLINLQRARRNAVSQQEKLQMLAASNADFNYVIKRVPKGFALLPEILTRDGEVFLLRSLPNEANKSFAQARALKPDYWPAYSVWVEFLIYSGNKVEAKRLVEAGLKYSPHSKVLREQYRLLGGN
jgi:hypothetical protein